MWIFCWPISYQYHIMTSLYVLTWNVIYDTTVRILQIATQVQYVTSGTNKLYLKRKRHRIQIKVLFSYNYLKYRHNNILILVLFTNFIKSLVAPALIPKPGESPIRSASGVINNSTWLPLVESQSPTPL